MRLSLRQKLGLAAKTIGALFGGEQLVGQAVGIFGAHGELPRRGTRAILEAYSQMPWLRAVASRIGFAVAHAQWQLFATGTPRAQSRGHREQPDKWDRAWYRDRRIQTGRTNAERKHLLEERAHLGELIEIEENPVLDLLNDPSDILPGVATRAISQIHLDLAGETFWALNGPELGGRFIPEQAFPLPPHWIKSTPTPSHPFYQVSFPKGGQFPIPMDRMLWIKDPDPLNPLGRGTGLGKTLGDELDTDEMTAKHLKQFFLNRARPDMIVSGKAWDEATRQRLEQEWMNKHQGFWRQYRPAFINDEITVKVIGQTFEELQLTKLREFERNIVVNVFGMPPEILGIIENSNRATIESAAFLFTRFVVEPRLEFLRDWFQQRLIPFFDDRLIIDFVSPVPEDKEFELNAAKVAPWARMVDEWRELQGLEPLPEGRGQVFLIPINLLPSRSPGGAAPTPMPEAEAAHIRASIEELETAQRIGPGPNGNDPTPLPAVANRIAGLLTANGKGRFTDADLQDPFYLLIQRISDRLEPRMRRAFLEAVEELQGAIDIGAIERALIGQGAQAALRLIPFEAFAERLGQEFTQEIRRAVQAAGEAAAAQLGEALEVTVGFDIARPNAAAFARNLSSDLVREITESTRLGVRELIARQFEEGITPRQIAQAVGNRTGLLERQQRAILRFEETLREAGVPETQIARRIAAQEIAQMRLRGIVIARTEMIRSANAGQQFVWEQAASDGLFRADVAVRTWLVTPDDRLDKIICEPMDGQQVGLKALFTTGTGGQVRFPPAHPQCRCAVALEFIEAERTITVGLHKAIFYLEATRPVPKIPEYAIAA